MNIVFCASEVMPFAKTGGLADVCGVLPRELAKLGHEVSIIMPGYKDIDAKWRKNNPYLWENGVKVHFIESKAYFERNGLYGTKEGDFDDNLKRFTYFCEAAITLIESWDKKVDIIHCHDWQSALIPVILNTEQKYTDLNNQTRTILTIHNLAYQGVFPGEQFPALNLDKKLFEHGPLEFYGKVNLLKAGIMFADCVTTVSPQYAKEILTTEYGCGLEGVLNHTKDNIAGILNGLDYDYWSPDTDAFLNPQYDAETVEVKAQHKQAVQEKLNLPVDASKPMFGFIGRLSHQKGIDLIKQALPDLLKLDAQFVFLGYGEQKYHDFLENMHKSHPDKIASHLCFDEEMAHRVYGASDFFLMPSVYEPCGLTQMIALRYGSIPVVYATGGLVDTIQDIDDSKDGNGFVFSKYKKEDLVNVVKRAVDLHSNQEKFQDVQARGFALRFTWDQSTQHYVELYEQCASSV